MDGRNATTAPLTFNSVTATAVKGRTLNGVSCTRGTKPRATFPTALQLGQVGGPDVLDIAVSKTSDLSTRASGDLYSPDTYSTELEVVAPAGQFGASAGKYTGAIAVTREDFWAASRPKMKSSRPLPHVFTPNLR